ncbi:hypothetical protein CRENBAI_023942 [Crenichthys baileyi]|uniref:C2H2-type domain-containing protein n=1 Tax=Crenichthys baileyi TaxID=28760 RepID=A0AAV9QY19_9TELE
MDAYETHLHQHALEEEESQLRDNRAPIGHMDTEEETGHEDGSVSVDGCDTNRSAQKQPELTQGVQYPRVSANSSRSVYTCGVCGKIYTYLVSFQKHQKIHENLPDREKPRTVIDSNLRNYECPDCGMLFIRRTRLISHLRVHRSKRRNKLPKCDQCNKVFTSVKSWTAHVELHKERRFWCLSCAQGFMNEGMLDKHLQSHSLRQQNHNADDQSIHNAKPLLCPPKIQRTHHCLHCGKRFWRSKTLFRHKLKHLQCQGGVTSKPPGSSAFNQGVEDMKEETSLTNRREKLEMDASMEELQVKEENMKIEDQSQHSAAEDGDQDIFEDSDCGEPGHRYEISELHRSDNQLDRPSSQAGHSPAGRERERAEPRLHREHKYWEWECIECDMGFDEMAKLHSHYVKHATGELPIPKEETER